MKILIILLLFSLSSLSFADSDVEDKRRLFEESKAESEQTRRAMDSFMADDDYIENQVDGPDYFNKLVCKEQGKCEKLCDRPLEEVTNYRRKGDDKDSYESEASQTTWESLSIEKKLAPQMWEGASGQSFHIDNPLICNKIFEDQEVGGSSLFEKTFEEMKNHFGANGRGAQGIEKVCELAENSIECGDFKSDYVDLKTCSFTYDKKNPSYLGLIEAYLEKYEGQSNSKSSQHDGFEKMKKSLADYKTCQKAITPDKEDSTEIDMSINFTLLENNTDIEYAYNLKYGIEDKNFKAIGEDYHRIKQLFTSEFYKSDERSSEKALDILNNVINANPYNGVRELSSLLSRTADKEKNNQQLEKLSKLEEESLESGDCKDTSGTPTDIESIFKKLRRSCREHFVTASTAPMPGLLTQCRNNRLAATFNEYAGPCISAHAVAAMTDRFEQEETFASVDNRFTCRRVNALSADYRSCKKAIQIYNASMVTEVGMNGVSQVTSSVNAIKTQEKIAEDRANGNIQTSALTAVERTAEYKQREQTARATFYSTKSVVLGKILASWPRPANIGRRCQKHLEKSDSDIFSVGEVNNIAERCNSAMNMRAVEIAYFPNLAINKAMKQEMFNALGASTSAAILAKQYKDQKNSAKDLKGQFEALEDDGGIDLQISACQHNPNAPGCSGLGDRVTSSGGVGFDVSMEDQNAQSYTFSDATGEFQDSDTSAVASADSKGTPNGLGKFFEGPGAQGDNATPPSSAGVNYKKSGSYNGGGGGGGGAGGGGGGGSGGGARGSSKTAGNKVKRGPSRGLKKYARSKYGGNKKRKKKGNPFDNLFPKGSKRRPANLSGGADIAPKHSNIFKRISNRYGKAHEDQKVEAFASSIK